GEQAYVAGELIVKTASDDISYISPRAGRGMPPPDPLPGSIEELNAQFGVQKVEPVFQEGHSGIRAAMISGNTSEVYLLKIKADFDVLQVAEAYSDNDEIEFAQPNYLYSALYKPNDTYYGEQYSHAKTSAEAGWNRTTGSSSITIAIVDTGLYHDPHNSTGWHEDLINNVWENSQEKNGRSNFDDDGNGFVDDYSGWNFVSNNNDPKDAMVAVFDGMFLQFSHGTHVAGIAAGHGNNEKGVAGVCYKCKVMPVKVLADDGFGSTLTISRGIEYATESGADIINLSLGVPEHKLVPNDDAMETAVNEAHEAGITVVAAAGNWGIDEKVYPAALDNVIAVGATNANDERWDGSQYGSWVDVAAPGQGICSAVSNNPDALRDCKGVANNNKYLTVSGTSMASPYVAGLVGLILSKNASLTPDQIKEILIDSGDPQNGSTISPGTPIGRRVNVARAVPISVACGDNRSNLDNDSCITIEDVELFIEFFNDQNLRANFTELDQVVDARDLAIMMAEFNN
ncbi:S8 family peptidase, partial [Patescibacteria group bacterium]